MIDFALGRADRTSAGERCAFDCPLGAHQPPSASLPASLEPVRTSRPPRSEQSGSVSALRIAGTRRGRTPIPP